MIYPKMLIKAAERAFAVVADKATGGFGALRATLGTPRSTTTATTTSADPADPTHSASLVPPAWSPSVPIPEDPLKWGDTFPAAAIHTLPNEQLRTNLAHATHTIRNKRDARAAELPDWEELRTSASSIKNAAMSSLPDLLEEVERTVTARGGTVHWARDAAEANRIALDLIRKAGVCEVVKVKSMVTQEIGLNDFLAEHGVTAFETDLAEMIVQLSDDMPSHIVVPAIHRNRTEVRDIFKARMAGAPEDLSDDPRELTTAARAYLRRKFLTSKVAISGANLIAADTGACVVVESEGNGRMCLTLPEVLISIVGIEKVVPRFRDFEVFGQLLPRSATGERMNPYTSVWTGTTPGDGPREFHLILLDNGRSRVLADPVGRQALHCVRCGACMNVCPVYERVGGHAYQSVYPGPIGAILTPQLRGAFEHGDPGASLPFASSLCGACFEACPVKIDIPSVLVDLRRRAVDAQRAGLPSGWDVAMKAAAKPLSSGGLMSAAGAAMPVGRAIAGSDRRITSLPWPVSAWTSSRDVPAPPAQTFRQWERKKGSGAGRGCACGPTSIDEGGADTMAPGKDRR